MTSPQARSPARESDELPYTLHAIEAEDIRAVVAALEAPRIVQGPIVGSFEAALRRETQVSQAVAVSSGTAALHVAMAALGVGPGDEVIVPALTYVATANAVLLCGARPVFADIDPETLTLDPEEVERKSGPRTRAVIAMHYGGHPAEIGPIAQAVTGETRVIEDACHALGATLDGRAVGSLAHAACFSFHAAKAITTGEGGAITTNDVDLADRACSLRDHGLERRPERFEGLGLPPELGDEETGSWVYEQIALATNYRLSEPAAALGLSQLKRLSDLIARRRAIASTYLEGLRDEWALELPLQQVGARSAWHLFPVRLRLEALRAGRAEVFTRLRARGIGVQVHYIPVHLQPYYRRALGTGWGDLPHTEAAYLRLLSLPLFPSMESLDVARVVCELCDVLRELRR